MIERRPAPVGNRECKEIRDEDCSSKFRGLIMDKSNLILNEQKPTDDGGEKGILIYSPTDTNTKRQIKGVDSLNECETRRIKLTELILWCVKPKLFLGRGPQAKWFVGFIRRWIWRNSIGIRRRWGAVQCSVKWMRYYYKRMRAFVSHN